MRWQDRLLNSDRTGGRYESYEHAVITTSRHEQGARPVGGNTGGEWGHSEAWGHIWCSCVDRFEVDVHFLLFSALPLSVHKFLVLFFGFYVPLLTENTTIFHFGKWKMSTHRLIWKYFLALQSPRLQGRPNQAVCWHLCCMSWELWAKCSGG